jgi:hypothetical protein
MLDQVPLVSVEINKHCNSAIFFYTRCLNELHTPFDICCIISFKIVCIEKQKHTTASLISDCRFLFCTLGLSEQDTALSLSCRREHDPTLGWRHWVVESNFKTKFFSVECNRLIIVRDENGSEEQPLMHCYPVRNAFVIG